MAATSFESTDESQPSKSAMKLLESCGYSGFYRRHRSKTWVPKDIILPLVETWLVILTKGLLGQN